MSEAATITEAEILADAIAPDRADMPVEAARGATGSASADAGEIGKAE
jgi:hypothetical protein